MKIKDLLSVLPEYSKLDLSLDVATREISEVCQDSRRVAKDSVFVALRGHKFDSHKVLQEVIAQEPAVLVVEWSSVVPTNYRGVVIFVPNTREALDALAGRWYGDPSTRLLCFGVTGTNGKTSCTYLMEHILNSVGLSTGVIGTINHHLKDRVWPSEMTTPGSLALQARLSEMLNEGAKALAMEVSSHALAQHRVDSVRFNTVLFTNLTRDHLDYHSDMTDYFKAKQRLFTDLLWKSNKVPQFAVVNTDDPWGRRLRVAGYAAIWTYGQNKNADFCFQGKHFDFNESEFRLKTPFGEFSARIPLCGLHNVYNAVGVIASAAALGVPVAYSLQVLQSFSGVPGRLQLVPNAKGLHIFVDYAHSPDALENVLQGLHSIRQQRGNSQRLITIFGCGGNRDKGKRPMMAKIAEQYSDEIIVTSDNPRTENPQSIVEQIKEGFKKIAPHVELDRYEAIRKGMMLAKEKDVILIAGKGHEDYQEIDHEKKPFNDFLVAQELVK